MTKFTQVGVQRSCLGQYMVSQVSPMLRGVGVEVMAVSDWPAPLCDAHNHVIFRSEVPSRAPGWLAVTVFSISRSNGTRPTLAWVPKFSLHDKIFLDFHHRDILLRHHQNLNDPRPPTAKHLTYKPLLLATTSPPSSRTPIHNRKETYSHIDTGSRCAKNTHTNTEMAHTDKDR